MLLLDNIHEKRDEWLAKRGIGSSDIGTIMGLSEWKTPYQLWAEKTGKAPPQSDSPAMRAGRFLERGILELASVELGPVKPCDELYCLEGYSWATATPDGFVVADDEQAIVEAKHVKGRQAHLWDGKIPDVYLLQVQWQLGILGLNQAWLAPLIGGDADAFELRKVVYDPTIFELCFARAERFNWHVVNDKEPEFSVDDLKLYQALHPPIIETPIELDFYQDKAVEYLKNKEEIKVHSAMIKDFEEANRELELDILLAMQGCKTAKLGDFVAERKIVHRKAYPVEASSYETFKIKERK